MDVDFYKFTMGQFICEFYRKTPVAYRLIIRKENQHLQDLVSIPELREQLDHVRTLKFNRSEIHYLRGTNEYNNRMFSENYLNHLSSLQLPEYQIFRMPSDDNYLLEFCGNWEDAVYWETIAMSIINELYFMNKLKKENILDQRYIYALGVTKLKEKIQQLQYKNLFISDFGTRRRFSHDWQEEVLVLLAGSSKNVNLYGTSNTYFAMKHGLMPIGTYAHELEMGVSGIMNSDEELNHVSEEVWDKWFEMYGQGLSIALSDTFTSKFFMKKFVKYAETWKGVRHDSGNPIDFGEKIIQWYKDLGIDPREKMIIFSDGLDIHTIVELYERFSERIKVSFGWGTNLTNDLYYSPLNLVIKLIVSDGNRVVKLSDNPSKATGNPTVIEKYMKAMV